MRRVLGLLSTALVLTACSGGGVSHNAASGPTSAARLPPGASVKPVPHTAGSPASAGAHAKGPAEAVINNGKVEVCSLITRGQINQIVGVTLPTPVVVPVGTFDECRTTQPLSPGSRAKPVTVAWAVPPGSQASQMFRADTINLPGSDAVSGVGSKAYCSTKGQSAAQLFVLSGSRFLEVFTDSCPHAVALAAIALARL